MNENTSISDNSTEDKRKVRQKRFANVLIVLGAATMIVCAVGFLIDYNMREMARSYYVEQATIERRVDDVPAFNPRRRQPIAITVAATDDDSDVQEIVEEVEFVPYVDFDALKAENRDYVAWIRLPGTIIDYPVMQGSDNDYYLERLPNRRANAAGSIFMDFRNSPDFTDKNTVIYGHYMRSGDMFTALRNYREARFARQNPYVYIYTPEKDYVIELIAGYLLDSAKEVPLMSFRDDDSFLQYVENIKNRSLFRSYAHVDADDRLVTLATCAYDFENARLVVVGVIREW
jgi:sortase B